MSIFARFLAREGEERAVEDAMREVIPETRREPDCLYVHGYRSTRDARLFYIHSRWASEAAFEVHATLGHTVRFIETVDRLCDSVEVTRSVEVV